MKQTTQQEFNCPHCGKEIEISELLANQIRSDLRVEFESEKRSELEKANMELEKKYHRQAEETEARQTTVLADLQAQLEERSQQAKQSQQKELELRKKARDLEQKQEQVELELQRRLDQEKDNLSRSIREQMDEEFGLRLLEKEKQIEDLRKSVAEVKRKTEVGSQELQGELLEMDIEERLSAAFPQDEITPVPKGVRGADLVQVVKNTLTENCGSIIWEAKNTKRWNQAWIEKLKDDQRNITAVFAVLVTTVLPPGIQRFGQVDGVWVCDLQSYTGLTIALRKYLIDLSFAQQASEGKNEKVEMIYRYLSGEEFKQRIEAIVDSFNSMQEQLARERRAMEKLWKEREKQIERITTNTVGMYGEMQGIIGSSLPRIKSLELDPD